jgi:hypothetical protein
MPLEFYPPTTNLLNSLAFKNQFSVKIWTTRNNKGRKVYKNDSLNAISRTSFPNRNNHKLVRLFKYLLFNIKTFLGLLIFNPSIVMYYETYSAGPVYWYLKYFGSKKKLFIHYHEYFNQEWYDSGMAIVKLYYQYEKTFLLQKAEWISHTNSYRIDLFLKDHPNLLQSKLHEMKNYPPQSWSSEEIMPNQKSSKQEPLKIVYVGSLSLEHTFIKEFCIWVLNQKGKVIFDIYAFNCSDSAIKYLRGIDSNMIKFYDRGLEYADIPKILVQYDLGVILYKATTPNAKFCASNKLFEYLVCGLDVWFSKEQLGTVPYMNYTTRPTVTAVDFKNLDITLIEDYFKYQNLPLSEEKFYFELETQKLINAFQC